MKSTLIASADLTLAVAKKIAQTAGGFQSEIRLLYRDKGANAKSLMGVVSLAYKKGAELSLFADGKDAAAAIRAIGSVL